jgi:hypothetical protein
MPKTLFVIVFFIGLFSAPCFAQDTLPNIMVKNYNGKIVISWKNNYGQHISNLNIQRSSDSLRNFTTIATVLNPMNKQNGIVDGKAPTTNMFYRVFVAFDGGTYIFTKSYRPVMDTFKSVDLELPDVSAPPAPPKDLIKGSPANAYVYGRLIYIGKDNNIIINLPDAATHKYFLKFYDDKNNFLFEINKIHEPYLIVDKVNFLHAGWFNYQLYDNTTLVEKYHIYIPKDGGRY